MTTTDKLSRRHFIQGLGLAGAGVVATGLMGCSSGAPTEGKADAGSAEAAWDKETDILVVGSGYAGLCAAIEAAEAGSEVVLLEKNAVLGGNSILCAGNAQFGGGNVVQKAAGIEDTPQRMYDDVFAYGKHRAVPELLQTFIDRSNECVDWLKDDLGVVFKDKVTANEGHSVPCSLTPDKSDAYPGSGGISYWYVMYDKATSRGVELLLEHQAVGFVQQDDGTVVGLEVETGGETKRFKARQAVIMGSGGWKSNEAMRLNYDPRLDSDLSAGGLPYVQTTGELTNEAVNIGAGTRDMSYVCEFRFKWGTRFYQVWDPVDIENPPSTGVGMSINDFAGVVLVKSDGTRFVDENAAQVYPQEPFYESYLNQAAPRSVWAVVDAAGAEALKWDIEKLKAPAEDKAPYLNPDYVAVADDLDELAKKIGVPADAFKAQIERYNGFASAGVDEEFGKEGIASPLVTAPFCAVKMQFFAHDQMGGLVANTKAQVCKRSEHVGPDPVKLDDQEVIPHLYAAGECVGGYVGCDRGHGKISMYMVFGRIAGQNAAAETPIA